MKKFAFCPWLFRFLVFELIREEFESQFPELWSSYKDGELFHSGVNLDIDEVKVSEAHNVNS